MAGYIGKSQGVTQVDGYNRSEADAEFVNDPNDVINVSGSNVGIGTTSPSEKLVVERSGAGNLARFTDGTYGVDAAVTSTGGSFQTANINQTLDFKVYNSGYMRFYGGTSGLSERMRIDSSGYFLVNRNASTGTVRHELNFAPSSEIGIRYHMTDTTYNNALMEFKRSDGTRVGYIYSNASSTSYVTSSDYRLKEDVQPMVEASDRLMALKPVNFAWKVDGSRVDGFLAHEAQEVVPEAVTGEKDAVDADKNPEYQGIDQSKLVPLLTAALQEALQKIDALEARVTTLEGGAA